MSLFVLQNHFVETIYGADIPQTLPFGIMEIAAVRCAISVRIEARGFAHIHIAAFENYPFFIRDDCGSYAAPRLCDIYGMAQIVHFVETLSC